MSSGDLARCSAQMLISGSLPVVFDHLSLANQPRAFFRPLLWMVMTGKGMSRLKTGANSLKARSNSSIAGLMVFIDSLLFLWASKIKEYFSFFSSDFLKPHSFIREERRAT